MTKALVCTYCVDIRGLDPDGGWVECRCGRVSARWLDSLKGTVKVMAAEHDRQYARILGLNNDFLVPALKTSAHEGDCGFWKTLHGEATNAPGYIFDESKRGCWACIVRVGETNDVSWEETQKP